MVVCDGGDVFGEWSTIPARISLLILNSTEASNQAIERTTDRSTLQFEMTSTPLSQAPRAVVRRRSSSSR